MRQIVARIALIFPLALAAGTTPAEAQFPYAPIYPGYRYAAPESDLKIKVTPRDAAVYIDGYFAGKVEEFDGAFERLHVSPGEHEIVVYLEGFRSLRQKLYLSPNATRKIEGTLEKLPAGAPIEPAPAPAPDVDRYARPARDRMPPSPRPMPGRGGPNGGVPRDSHRPPDGRRDRPEAPQGTNSGALSIRVQPSGAIVLIDGERWTGPADNERLVVQLPEGRHRVEVEQDGYAPFVLEIDVRRGETAPVNISLTKAR